MTMKEGTNLVGTHCKWGWIDTAHEIIPGMVAVSTPSHGGVRLSPEINALIPSKYRRNEGSLVAGWYEEDCEWSIAFWFLRNHIINHSTDSTSKAVVNDGTVLRTLKAWYPTIYKDVIRV